VIFHNIQSEFVGKIKNDRWYLNGEYGNGSLYVTCQYQYQYAAITADQGNRQYRCIFPTNVYKTITEVSYQRGSGEAAVLHAQLGLVLQFPEVVIGLTNGEAHHQIQIRSSNRKY